MSWLRRRIGTERFDYECPREKLPTKERPHFNTKQGRTYTPKRTQDTEKAIREAYQAQSRNDWHDHAGEVRVCIVVRRPLPRSAARKYEGSADLMAPDVDNLSKAFLDSLNGLAYADDRQVTRLLVLRMPRAPFRETATVRVRIDYYAETYSKEKK